MISEKNRNIPIIAIVVTVALKCLFLLTKHIQEDAFITWRVAQNLLNYGVIGFNGETKISASTTHLYVFISYLFNLIFGKENFVEPLLIFNSILFSIGSYFLARLLLKNPWHQAIFIFLFGILPPSIKISILGMEYGILFFLEMSLLYFGFHQRKKWAFLVLPAIILFTRLDTVIFLGIAFLADWIWTKKWNWNLVIGGLIGVIILVSFNWFYFGELVNNTIVAKKLTYEKDFSVEQHWQYFNLNWGNYWGMFKIPQSFNPFTLILLIFELICFIALVREKKDRNLFLWIIFLFAWAKQIIFISQKSYFDWYYWVPQILLFGIIIVFVLEQRKSLIWTGLLCVFYIIPMFGYQVIHSIATGNGEWNYRRNIGLFLDQHEKDKNQWILLEPAGFVPYFSGLKTIDEVGLVDRGIQDEISKDRKNYWLNTVKNRKPKYLLSYSDLYTGKDSVYYQENYQLLKEFRIKDALHHENKWIEKIYKLKPSGSDYNLYQRK